MGLDTATQDSPSLTGKGVRISLIEKALPTSLEDLTAPYNYARQANDNLQFEAAPMALAVLSHQTKMDARNSAARMRIPCAPTWRKECPNAMC